ncbi:galacturonosyltransferase 4 isoform X2 [Wolffia australiana]
MGKMKSEPLFLIFLALVVLGSIVVYTDMLSADPNSVAYEKLKEELSGLSAAVKVGKLNAVSQESPKVEKEQGGIAIVQPLDGDSFEEEPVINSSEDTPVSDDLPVGVGEHRSRVLSEAEERKTTVIQQVTEDSISGEERDVELKQITDPTSKEQSANSQDQASTHSDFRESTDAGSRKSDVKVHRLRDQLIRAKVFLNLGQSRSSPHYIRELRVRIREVQRALGEATVDSDLPRNIDEKMRSMEQTLGRGQQIQDNCAAVVKKLRATLHSTEEQLRINKKQALFLTQLAAKTLPKGLHCLPLRLSNEYYSLNPTEQQFPHQEKLEDPNLYHYAIFSDNVLATAVVVNSTVTNAKEPWKHVVHVVTDKLNYAAMRMWFLKNPPGAGTMEVRSIDEFTWLNASYSPALKQLQSQSMIDYYFKTHRANADPNLKYRNPKYLSILNHLRFYLPEVFPKLNKVLFLDDDVVVQKDLGPLWKIKLDGKVNGAVETCGESFHRFDRYLNFSHPLIAKNFDPRACGWAYGMNIFDLVEWKKQKVTEIYHHWQHLNSERTLWKLGTLPPGLITFWKRTLALDRSWHVLGLGYNPGVSPKDIERAAVVHYNGNLKPWLEIAIPKFRGLWSRFIDYDHPYLRDCNITP